MSEEQEQQQAYKPEKVKVMPTCFVDPGILERHEACVFQGEFYDKENKRCTYTAMPDTLKKCTRTKIIWKIFKKVGLDGYFSLPPCGVDLQRSYELMSSLNDEGVATMTNLEGEEVQVKIDEALISEALNFKTKGAVQLPHQLSDAERNQTFLYPEASQQTFKNLSRKEVGVPLMLYSQHFHLQKPPKYTLPNKRLAGFMTNALQKNKTQPALYAKTILGDMMAYPKSKTFSKKPHIGAGHMLTRIAYQALGAADKLPVSYLSKNCYPAQIPKNRETSRRFKTGKGKERAGRTAQHASDEESEESEEEEEHQQDLPDPEALRPTVRPEPAKELRTKNREDLLRQARAEKAKQQEQLQGKGADVAKKALDSQKMAGTKRPSDLYREQLDEFAEHLDKNKKQATEDVVKTTAPVPPKVYVKKIRTEKPKEADLKAKEDEALRKKEHEERVAQLEKERQMKEEATSAAKAKAAEEEKAKASEEEEKKKKEKAEKAAWEVLDSKRKEEAARKQEEAKKPRLKKNGGKHR